MKLIDGDKLKEMLHTAAIPMTEYGRGVQTGYQYARAFIDNMPEIEAETVRHGRWIPHDAYEEYDIAYCDYVCGECGHEITKRLLCVPPRCENCGAKMDGGDENG